MTRHTLYTTFAAFAFAASSHAATTVPYLNDFTSAANGYSPITSGFDTNATYNLNTAAGLYEASITGDRNNAAWELDMAPADFGGNFATANDFTITATVQWTPRDNDDTDGINQIAIWLLGDDLSTSSQNWYRALINADGDVLLEDRTGGSNPSFDTLDSGSINSFTLSTLAIIDLTITGTYIDSNNDLVNDSLSLTFTADRGGGDSVTLMALAGVATGADTANTYTGHQIATQFRSGDAVSPLPSGLDAAVVSFTVVPEPVSLALLAMGGLGLLSRRPKA